MTSNDLWLSFSLRMLIKILDKFRKQEHYQIKPKLQELNLILPIYLPIIIHDCTALLSKFMNKYYWMIFHKQCIYALSNKKNKTTY